MLKQLPRIPSFPEHIINKTIKRIEKDVEDDVIPVSAGIYSEMKLMERLQAIPKPNIPNYQDIIFYEIIDPNLNLRKSNNCPSCGQQYDTKRNIATQCNFCGIWNCSNCICSRKRYHPQATQSNSERYNICIKCDSKFLSLSLNHDYFQKKSLYQQVIKRIRKEKDYLQLECQKKQKDSNFNKQTLDRNKFLISSLKKEKIDLKKDIIKMQSQREDQTFKMQIREKYLAALMKKKKVITQMVQKQEKAQQQIKKPIISNIQKEDDKVDRSQSILFRKAIQLKIQKNQVNQEIIIKQQPAIIPQALEQHKQQQQQQNNLSKEQTKNFFNYHQWGSESYNQNQFNTKNNINDMQTTDVSSKIGNIAQEPKKQTILSQKLAQIFSKPQIKYESDEQDDDDKQSLDEQVIKMKKSALIKTAIETSQKKFLNTFDQSQQTQIKKCSCNIY